LQGGRAEFLPGYMRHQTVHAQPLLARPSQLGCRYRAQYIDR
jgi:hypothetical protein